MSDEAGRVSQWGGPPCPTRQGDPPEADPARVRDAL